MWRARSDELTDGRGLRYTLELGSAPATFADVIHGWQGDASFRAMFGNLLADAPYRAYRWETPPVTDRTSSRPFEFVVLDSPGLERPPDANAFVEHFGGAPESGIIAFSNLGGDAIMV